MIKKVDIIGAGAMGCLFGANFAENGFDVTLVDSNPDTVSAINTNGIIVEDSNGSRNVKTRATLFQNGMETDADMVLFCVKSSDTEMAASGIVALNPEGTLVLTLQNGLGNREIINNNFIKKKENIIRINLFTYRSF